MSVAVEPTDRQQRLRDAAGRFTTGVTVVTTAVNDTVRGMTANGFMSVSLEPELVVVSVRNQSRMHGFLGQSGTYGVSVLSIDQQVLSAHFAGVSAGNPPVSFFEAGGAPLISGALAQIAAAIVDSHSAGDHTLYIAEVTHVAVGEGQPLIFHRGSYRALRPEYEWSATWPNASDWI